MVHWALAHHMGRQERRLSQGPEWRQSPYAVPIYPIATVCELKSVLSASMHFTLVKLELNLHSFKHVNQVLLPSLPCSS